MSRILIEKAILRSLLRGLDQGRDHRGHTHKANLCIYGPQSNGFKKEHVTCPLCRDIAAAERLLLDA